MLSALIQRADEEIVAEVNGLEKPLKTGQVMFSDYAEHTFLPAHEHKKSYNNDATEISVIVRLAGDHALGSFGRREVERLEKALMAENLNKGKRKAPRFRTVATVNRYMALLRHIFSHAIEEGLVRENPVHCYVPYIEEPKRRDLTDEEIGRVLQAAEAYQLCLAHSKTGRHIYEIIAVALNTGMRLGEILHLKREYIRDGLIVVPYAETKSRRRSLTERAKVKVIPINAVVRAIFDAQPEGAFVFDLDAGRDHSSVKRAINDIRKMSRVPEFTTHYLRHTVSTRLASSMSIATAKEMLGHSNLATTLRYTHPSLEEKRGAGTFLGTLFSEITHNLLNTKQDEGDAR